MSGSSWVRRRSSTGVRSAPPPNHALVVTTKRVFMCTAGTFGLRICAISEMPDAQNRGSSAAPGICARNSGANSPCTVEQCTPTFSNSRPRITLITPPPPGSPVWSVRSQARAHETPGVAGIERCRRIVLELLEGRADIVAQALEPGPSRAPCDLRSRTCPSLAPNPVSRLRNRFAAAPRPAPSRQPSRHSANAGRA